MFNINNIRETEKVVKLLEKRQLIKAYQKAKQDILAQKFSGNFLKYRQPKKDQVLYFRVNKQFRALGELRDNTLVVSAIDNHQ